MEEITLKIDGKLIVCPAGTSILNAAEENGIKIPTLCNHHSLKPAGACRICIVEDETSGRIFASCVTPVAPDMVIQTASPAVLKHRTNIVRLMMAEHPESCVVCGKGNRCELRKIAAKLGIGESTLYPMPNYKRLEQANPFIVRDLSKCILCGKCIRADHELVHAGAIDYNLRGFKSRPAAVHDLPLEKSNCTFCGTCISICPTGALSVKSTYTGTPDREAVSICSFCGIGCMLSMGVSGNQVVDVNPAHKQGTVNEATLCVRGHFANDFLNSPDRLTQPLILGKGEEGEDELIPSTWDDAIGLVAEKLIKIRDESGPQSIAFLGSSKCTNEENYLFQKIARVALGTSNIDNGGYIYGRQLLSLIERRNDHEGRYDLFAGSLSNIETADIIFLLDADPDHSAPVASYYLKRAVSKGVPLVIAGTRKTGLAASATSWLKVTLNGDIDRICLELVNGMSRLILENGGHDAPFVDRFTEGFDQYLSAISLVDVNQVSSITGIDSDTLEKTANLLKGKKIAFVVGSTISQLRYGKEIMEALLNLALATGSTNYNRAGFHVISKESNLVGAWHRGTVPDSLPGSYFLNNASSRKQWEMLWQKEISDDEGLDMVGMIEAAEKGDLKALYIMGENPLRSLPQPERVLKAFEKIDFLVVQDILATETTNIADVVLPGAAMSEKNGSVTNMEGRHQSFNSVVRPPGKAKPDFEILGMLAEKMGVFKGETSLDIIRNETMQLVQFFIETGEEGYSVWIKDPETKAELEQEDEGLIGFSPVVSSKDVPDDKEYPLTAILGSQRYHLGSGTRTSRSMRISELNGMGRICISPKDSADLELNDGALVRIVSAHGSVEREVQVDKGQCNGMILIPTAYNNNDARNLVQLTRLFDSETPGWLSCRVKVEKI